MLAIDPSSPFSGGAILGDRVRMQNHALDDKVSEQAERALAEADLILRSLYQLTPAWMDERFGC